jgi:hypothetical protein
MYFYWEPISLATNSQKLWFPYVPLKIIVRNKLPSKNIIAGAIFLTVISRGT